jgi:hypothetical protein
MDQTSFNFDSPIKKPVCPAITGDDYDRIRDGERLTRQLDRIFAVCLDGRWRTVGEIRSQCEHLYQGTFFPENSVQAQLRNLRKLGVTVDRRHITDGLSEYRVDATAYFERLKQRKAS